VSDQRPSARSASNNNPKRAAASAQPAAKKKKKPPKAAGNQAAAKTPQRAAKKTTAKSDPKTAKKRASAKSPAQAANDRRSTAAAEALRSLVVGLDGQVTGLEAGRDYRFGRDPACDVVALDSLVSRAHCRVRWDADRLWILEDLDSANGTWLGEQRLREPHVLADHDVFRIGGQEYRFQFVPPGLNAGAPVAEPPDARKRTVGEERSASIDGDTRFDGSFGAVDLPQLLCYFAMSARSGLLRIDHGATIIQLVAGVPRDARCAEAVGIQALRRTAAAEPEVFTFVPGDALAERDWTIVGSAEAVMLAAFGPAERPPLDPQDLLKAEAQQRRSMSSAPALAGLSVGITYQALCGVGGDFYELATLADGRILALIGDVSGHGVQGALVVAGMLRSLRYLAPACIDLRALAADLDRDSHRDLLPGQFSTVVMAAIDVATGTVEVLLAGHHPARLAVPGHLPRPVGRIGPAIGLSGLRVDPARLQIDHCDLQPGATLVLFSDALLEARDPAGREFADHGLDHALEHLAAAEDLQAGVSALAEACRAHAGTVDDDLSILALRLQAAFDPADDASEVEQVIGVRLQI
jgi:serine phosphatase RsbU (regulator of sigma subunit)